MAASCLSHPLFLFLFLFLFVGLRIIHPALGAVPRFAAFDDATLLPAGADVGAGGGFAPRWYMGGIPAVPAQPVSPNPRHAQSGHRLGARQEYSCAAGKHSCVEIGAAGTCCDNDRYCYLNTTWAPNCCPLGLKCPDSQCGADQQFCNQTTATTVAVSSTAAAASSSGGRPQQPSVVSVTSVVSFVAFSACCNRACKTTAFSCEPAFGGQCCPYGYKCAVGGNCINDPAHSTATSVSTLVPQIPSGCTTSQITCAQTDGGGCCFSGSICTFQTLETATRVAVCAPDPAASGGNGGDSSSSGALTTGARAGIGVGVAVAAAIIIGAVTWLCVKQRHKKDGSGGGAPGTSPSGHAAAEASARGDQDQIDSLLNGPPQTPFTPGSAGFSDAYERQYFGADPVVGPFTDLGPDGHADYLPGLATTPPAVAGGAPFHPDDIRGPVEVDASGPQRDREKEQGQEQVAEAEDDPTAGRFELMGSPPLNPEGLDRAVDKGPSSPSLPGTGTGPK